MLKKSRKYRLFLQILICLFAGFGLMAQNPVLIAPVLDTLPPDAASSTRAVLPVLKDSAVVDLSQIKISNDGLTETIDYSARDSMWFDVTNKQVHLYGVAQVKYTTLEIKSGYILLDYGKNEVTAVPYPDSSGAMAGMPQFKDKDQEFTASKLRYNFKSKKGIIYEARTKQEDLYVLGTKAKFIGPPDSDTTSRATIYNQDAILTTCNADHPHFGIRTKKLKVIPDKLVVTGMSNLELAGIPTPLILPFGFYPITKKRKAGLILPQDFNFAQREGLGIKDFGWYQPINEHMDVTTTFQAYVIGSFGVNSSVRYNYKYRCAGNLALGFNRRIQENDRAGKDVFPSYSIRWSHNQDPNAHPTRRFNGSVNVETNRDQNRNRNDYQSVYQNTLSSNLNYSRSFPGRPYAVTAGFKHTQNTRTRKMNITLPEATFTLQRIYPFKRKNPIGNDKWYEKVSLTYNSQLSNTTEVPDTMLFTDQIYKNIKSGIQHRASSDFNFKIFKYINVAPNISMEEVWTPFAIQKTFDNTIRYKYDTIFSDATRSEIQAINVDSVKTLWGKIDTTRNYGFNRYNNYNAGISVGTVLFATKQFKHGWLRGVRHKITPSMSFGFGPDFSDNTKYFKTVQNSNRPGLTELQRTSKYSIFEQSIYNGPSQSQRSMAINYSLLNVLEIKHLSKRDTTGKGKKVKIFDNLNFSGSYSITADSLKWSPVGTSGVIRLWKNITTLNWMVRFDPYKINEKGIKVDRLLIKEEGKLVRLDNFGIQLNTNLTIGQIRQMIEGKDDDSKDNKGQNANRPVGGVPDDFLGWFDNFSVNHRISFERQYVRGTNRDTLVIGGNNIGIQGNIPLSSKWTLNINNINYDFESKQFVYPDLGLTRDLHCWEMRFSWQPTRGTYSFAIYAKPGTFQFLKAPYRKNNFDAQGGF